MKMFGNATGGKQSPYAAYSPPQQQPGQSAGWGAGPAAGKSPQPPYAAYGQNQQPSAPKPPASQPYSAYGPARPAPGNAQPIPPPAQGTQYGVQTAWSQPAAAQPASPQLSDAARSQGDLYRSQVRQFQDQYLQELQDGSRKSGYSSEIPLQWAQRNYDNWRLENGMDYDSAGAGDFAARLQAMEAAGLKPKSTTYGYGTVANNFLYRQSHREDSYKKDRRYKQPRASK